MVSRTSTRQGIFSPMRFWVAFGCLLAASVARAERILLVPLDSRPAAGQFAQMIGHMANVEIVEPPLELLGRFTTPGKPEAILQWLKKQSYTDVTAVILST